MTLPAALDDLLAATWPPAGLRQMGAVTLRRGAGGGARVSAATAPGALAPDQINAAARQMRAWGQAPRWRIGAGDAGQADLDAQLSALGYAADSPTTLMRAPVAQLAAMDLQVMSAFRSWPALAVQREIWAGGGIGPARLAVMDRARTPKVTLLGRAGQTPAGTAFVALHAQTAVVHALEVRADKRRRGLARNMMVAAARWAQEQGATDLALLVTEANTAAQALYAAMGFDSHAGYHYRLLQEETHDPNTH